MISPKLLEDMEYLVHDYGYVDVLEALLIIMRRGE